VYEPEPDSTTRRIAVDQLASLLDVKTAQRGVFDRRVRSFLVDNERGKKVRVKIGAESFELGKTGPDGHVERDLEVKVAGGEPLPATVSYDGASIDVVIPVMGARGRTVVSDIDDTIKVTEVLDKKALLANTFLEEFRAIDGMAPLYAAWKKDGADFHYLSASPWQLVSELDAFLDRSGFPRGPLHLRKARTNSLKTPVMLLAGSRDHKIGELTRLLGRFPQRTFLLVGDSGEQDPEIYGEIHRSHPDRIERIIIRRVTGADHSDSRWKTAFREVPQEKWRLFENPSQLASD
jgi:phosphatidate phosphatase APP1